MPVEVLLGQFGGEPEGGGGLRVGDERVRSSSRPSGGGCCGPRWRAGIPSWARSVSSCGPASWPARWQGSAASTYASRAA
ncbi:hypothetical protein ACFQQB_30910 [Nonomuraea rubra]|uniref:hypothetical protein n=1 Tax=Nonomuraea rubra TaxID=46180 RepID=UPI00361C6A0D